MAPLTSAQLAELEQLRAEASALLDAARHLTHCIPPSLLTGRRQAAGNRVVLALLELREDLEPDDAERDPATFGGF